MKTKVINKEVSEDVSNSFDTLRKYAERNDKKSLNALIFKVCNWFDSLEEKEVEGIPSSPYEFQVGDLVEVQGHPSGDNNKWDETEGFDNSWISDMNSFVGKEFEVEDVHASGVYLVKGSEGWRFPPQALKLISKAK
jgi:hypothetical protein